MNAPDNKQRMQTVLVGMARGDLAPFVDAMADDVRWVWMGSGDWSRTFEGKDAVVNELLAAANDSLADGGTTMAHAFIAEGDHVVVEHTGRNATRDGRPYENRYCWVCRFADGKLVELREYMDTDLVAKTFG